MEIFIAAPSLFIAEYGSFVKFYTEIYISAINSYERVADER